MVSKQIRAILDVEGNIKSTHDYEPFGVELQPLSDESTNFKYKYTGQERDYSTNLDYMHARFYGSSIGRFLRPDPVNGNPANPQSWNLYAYVGNNPINLTDPTGMYVNVPNSKKEAKLPSPSGCAWFSNMVGMSGTSWVTTTWQTTVNYYESTGTISTSVVVTWTTTVMYDIGGGMPVQFTFSTDEESIETTAGPLNADPALYRAGNMDIVNNSVEAILMNAPSVYEQLIMLAIGMRESLFGLMDPTNPTQLSPDSGFDITGSISENVAHSYSILEERLRWFPEDLTTAIQRYNGANDQINYEKRWRMTYENILRTLTWNEAWSEPWP